MSTEILAVCLGEISHADGSMIGLARRLAIQIAVVFVYFAPSVIAQRYHHPKQTIVLMLNLALGWTIVAWVVVLLWARRKQSDNNKPRAADDFSAAAHDKAPAQAKEATVSDEG